MVLINALRNPTAADGGKSTLQASRLSSVRRMRGGVQTPKSHKRLTPKRFKSPGTNLPARVQAELAHCGVKNGFDSNPGSNFQGRQDEPMVLAVFVHCSPENGKDGHNAAPVATVFCVGLG